MVTMIDPLNGNDVSKWFAAYFAPKQRKRPCPSGKSCEEIAAIVNAHRCVYRRIKDTSKSVEKANREIDEVFKLTGQAEAEVKTLKKTILKITQKWQNLEKSSPGQIKNLKEEI